MSGYTFYNAVDQVNHYMPGAVIDFQVKQISLEEIEINLKICSRYEYGDVYALFMHALDDQCLNGVDIEFVHKDFILNPVSGKANHIICK